jgi:hypothetical protein
MTSLSRLADRTLDRLFGASKRKPSALWKRER